MSCDTNEPTATTGAGGAFTLTIPEGTTASEHPIVVQVSASTVDEDTGTAVGKPYVLSAPAGESDFISPLTTVVHGLLQQNPALTVEDAVTQVKLSIGASADISVFEDYVAAKQDSSNTAAGEYERLHRVAQVAAKALAENHEDIMAAANTQGIDTTEANAALLALVTSQVFDGLQSAANAVDEAGESFDIDAVTVPPADFADLAQQIESAEQAASSAKLSIESLLNQGAYWLWSDQDEFEYGFVKASSEPNRIVESWSFYEAGAWTTSDELEDAFYLSAEGWAEATDSGAGYVVTHQSDGTAILDLEGTNFSLKFSAAELDVAGKPIKDYLGYVSHQPVAETIAGDPVFSSGAKVYQVNFIVRNDAYVLYNWYDCEGQPHTDLEGNCNVLYGYVNGEFRPAHSFAELIYPSAPNGVGNWFSVGDGLEIRVVANGTLEITDKNEDDQRSLGQWEYRTVHGEQIMMLTLPSRFTPRLWDQGQQIVAVRGGFARRGVFTPAGTAETIGEVQFNETAFTDIQNGSSVY
ncbi:hypothetical protein GCM10011487_69840 [Steroidobacter agaridevorans]|uniref:Uncharacterized protein n=2 Tax=Steroidobacter agaridevorans TaxID=2695856 RepID=A0A829YNE1_9GAMM|nr:hypothetical protein GCM10011487_69840 [Steroidobacter agaridevorans]